MTSRGVVAAGAALLLLAGAAGCGGSVDGTYDGDCVARVKYGEDVYEPLAAAPRDPPVARALGDADVVGCGDVATGLRVTVRAVRGVPAQEAIAVVARPGYRGVYVLRDLPRDQWSAALVRVVARP